MTLLGKKGLIHSYNSAKKLKQTHFYCVTECSLNFHIFSILSETWIAILETVALWVDRKGNGVSIDIYYLV